MSLTASLKAALVVGLLAGLVSGTIHFVFTEPLVDEAIEFEESHAGTMPREPIVSRGGQKVGLVVASTILGWATASVFGLVFALTYGGLPGASPFAKSLVLGLSAYVATFAAPFLKYPANPPGVGDPETIFFRQALYVGFQLVSLVGVTLAYVSYHWLDAKRRSRYLTTMLPVVIYVTSFAAAYALMPTNPDPVPVPLDLLADFRVLSFVGQTSLWVILAVAYGKTWRLFARVSGT